jgi:ATP-dependent Clp protease, protease subunit
MRSYRARVLGIALLLCSIPAIGQQPPQQAAPPAPPERAIINFIVPIDSNTVNMLLSVVNNQIRAGVKKITIVLSSPGGDTNSAFAAYNILRTVPAEITTYNVGNIDSAAMLIFCAGKYRYSFPSPTRFLIHSNALVLGAAVPLDYTFLDAQLQQIKSLNQMIVQVIAANSNKKQAEIEGLLTGQTILSADEAKRWGIVQEIRTNFMEPGAVFVTVNTPVVEEKKLIEHTTIQPFITSNAPKP